MCECGAEGKQRLGCAPVPVTMEQKGMKRRLACRCLRLINTQADCMPAIGCTSQQSACESPHGPADNSAPLPCYFYFAGKNNPGCCFLVSAAGTAQHSTTCTACTACTTWLDQYNQPRPAPHACRHQRNMGHMPCPPVSLPCFASSSRAPERTGAKLSPRLDATWCPAACRSSPLNPCPRCILSFFLPAAKNLLNLNL